MEPFLLASASQPVLTPACPAPSCLQGEPFIVQLGWAATAGGRGPSRGRAAPDTACVVLVPAQRAPARCAAGCIWKASTHVC